ncbi:hypothetical protein [Pseudogemmobacter bohemicus]|uniref:hypothetical protein n=1 Tax=Pseudogemmobacter bohemicus TaxID=2250708 RepID=UPI000DD2D7C1|nr:hypothetical protein [Pseudogemmobacter bohemicus]
MALTIPEAQTPFSMVEQPRLNPNAPTGLEGLGALADNFVAFSARKVQAENDRLVRETRLSAMNDMDQARLEFETDGNLEGLTSRWEATAGSIADKYAQSLPEYLREDFNIGLRETIAPQTSAIRRREFALFQDRERAAFNSSMRDYERLAATAPDGESRDAVFRNVESDLQRQVDAGLLSAVEAEAIMADLPANTARIEARRLIIDDPAAYLDRAKEFEAVLDPAEASDFGMLARKGIADEQIRLTKEAEVLGAKEAQKLKSDIDSAIKVIEAGLEYDGLMDLADRARGNPEEYDRLRNAVVFAEEESAFLHGTPSEQKAMLAEFDARPTTDPNDPSRRDRLEKARLATVEALARDPLGHVAAVSGVDMGTLDLADPASMKERREMALGVYQEWTPSATTVKFFTAEEAEKFGAVLSGKDPDQAIAVIAAIDRGFGDLAPLALDQLGEKDPVAHLAGRLALDTGDMAASRAILRGRAMEPGSKAKMASEYRAAVQAEMSALFGTRMGPDGIIGSDSEALATFMQAVDDHYAATALDIADPKSAEGKAAVWRSAQAVASRTNRGGQAFGGVQTVHGRDTVLPARLDARLVEQALRYFDESQWKRASETGNLPLWERPKGYGRYAQKGQYPVTDFSPDERRNLVVLPVGDGRYALGTRQQNNEVKYLFDPGHPQGIFVFDLEEFALGTSRWGQIDGQ